MKSDLLKYYNKVKICKKCKREYGLDIEEYKEIDLCPICVKERRDK